MAAFGAIIVSNCQGDHSPYQIKYPDFSGGAGNISSIRSFNGSKFFHINYKPQILPTCSIFMPCLHHYSYDHDFTYWNACFDILKMRQFLSLAQLQDGDYMIITFRLFPLSLTTIQFPYFSMFSR